MLGQKQVSSPARAIQSASHEGFMNNDLCFPLETAYLCDCGMVGNSAMRCPSCLQEHGLLTLQTVLDRETTHQSTLGLHAAVYELERALA